MKRWLEENVGSASVDGVPRRELFRLAAESRLIADLPRWMEFHQARNQTSHTYEEKRRSSLARSSIGRAFSH